MRVKRGINKKRKHKKLLKQAKGYRLTYSKLYRRAKEAVGHANQYSFQHRKRRKSEKRTEWIKTISAGLTQSGVSYKDFISALAKQNIILDRKVLAELAMQRPDAFAKLVESTKN